MKATGVSRDISKVSETTQAYQFNSTP